jgi:four helix bundle protein
LVATNQQSDAFEMAVQLFQGIYQETETWPRVQVFGLIMDIRRVAMGIPSNLNEGQRLEGAEFLEFLTTSQNSLAELKDHLLVASKNPALSAAKVEPLLQQVEDLGGKLQRLAASKTLT